MVALGMLDYDDHIEGKTDLQGLLKDTPAGVKALLDGEGIILGLTEITYCITHSCVLLVLMNPPSLTAGTRHPERHRHRNHNSILSEILLRFSDF